MTIWKTISESFLTNGSTGAGKTSPQTNKTYSPKAISFLKEREDFRATAYKPLDTDVWTVGYGRTGPDVNENTTTTKEEASGWLEGRLHAIADSLNHLIKIAVTQDEFDALCSLCYNIGVGAFASSKALGLLNKGDIPGFEQEAFDPIRGFVRSGGKIIQGLVNRRALEEQLFRGEI